VFDGYALKVLRILGFSVACLLFGAHACFVFGLFCSCTCCVVELYLPVWCFPMINVAGLPPCIHFFFLLMHYLFKLFQ